MKRAVTLKKLFYNGALAAAVLILILLTGSCSLFRKPIKIGLSLTLTGFHAASQIEARDAIILAVEEVNKKGGIKGRPIELIIKNNKSDSEVVKKVTQELIDEGVTAIIGNSSSFLTKAALSVIKEHDILFISTGGTSANFSGIDDQLIRITSPVDKRAPYYAKLFLNKLKAQKVIVVYDIFNANYTESSYKIFKEEFQKIGGELIPAVTYNSKEDFDAAQITAETLKESPEGVYIIGNALYAALLCQHIRKLNSEVRIVESEWGFTSQDFINTGGPAVEGVSSISAFNYHSDNKNFIKFKRSYESRFNTKASGYSTIAYDAITILIHVLKKTTNRAKLKKVLIEHRSFDGVDGEVIIDQYGDPYRPLYYSTIINGQIIATERIEPNNQK